MRLSSNVSGMKSMLSALSVATIFALLECSTQVNAQVYMHNPRGSNNRVAETTTTVKTENRLFRSLNNRRGGYNVGDRGANAFTAGNPYINKAGSQERDLVKMYNADVEQNGQYDMQYIEGSRLQVQWMNEHGCGGDITDVATVNCELILQYMCQTQPEGAGATQRTQQYLQPGSESLLNGGNSDQPAAPTTQADIVTTSNANTAALRGRHESEQYYYECSKRSRNLNLFTGASQAQLTTLPNGKYAMSTRQNPTAIRGGLECNEERDYYPYWSPSPWKDMAILTDHSTTTCQQGKFLYASQNDHATYKCVPQAGLSGAAYDAQIFPITKAACEAANGAWTAYTHMMPPPDCLPAPWSLDNHLGNGYDGKPLSYDWILPSLAQLETSGAVLFNGAGTDKYAKCVMRFRYNITLDEFDPYQVNAGNNTSPIIGTENNPEFNIAPAGQDPFKVKVNLKASLMSTTYEDRSHTFYIRSRPAAFEAGSTIVNLNVRGKRCNIVQCHPAVEYDYAPHDLVVSPKTYVHLQWTGSNTHNNDAGNNLADDGQDGSAGEGKANSDRHNIAQVLDMAANYPLPLDKFSDNMWTRSQCFKSNGQDLRGNGGNAASVQAVGGSNDAATECALHVTTSGQLRTIAQVQAANDGTFQTQLDAAPASLIGGVVMRYSGVTAPTKYYYVATRNNNFTNRGQKGTLSVVPDLPPAEERLSS